MTPKEKRYHKFYMDVALRTAELSHCNKRKVGAVAVYNGNIIAFGFNGTPAGHCNSCEDDNGNTLNSVVHAEENLLKKLSLRGTHYNTFIYVTKEPCLNCAGLLKEWDEIERIYYREESKSRPGEGIFELMKQGKLCAQI